MTVACAVFFLAIVYWAMFETEVYEIPDFDFRVTSSDWRDVNGTVLWDISAVVSGVTPQEHDNGLWREFGFRVVLKDGTVAHEYANLSSYSGAPSNQPGFFVRTEDYYNVQVGDALILSGLDASYEGARLQFIHGGEIWGTFKLPATFSKTGSV